MSIVASFQTEFVRFIDPMGQARQTLPAFAQEPENLIAMYRAMVLTRTFDRKAVALQRTGQLGTYASSLGQEAVGVGVGSALRVEDVLVPSYREYGAQLLRGVKMRELLQYWGGDERGSDFSGPREDFPICVPVASQACHAVGAAYAMQLRSQARVAVCVLGDGATSKGDFYESINAAGTWKLPVIFVVNNNQWAISVPREQQTGAETLAQKAIAAGFPGIQVDGDDVLAVRFAAEQALARARGGKGPTLIEALTYRLCDHTTADDATRYRAQDEVRRHWEREPIARLRAYLSAAHGWSDADEESLLSACAKEVETEVQAYLTMSPQPISAMFDHLYAALPASLRRQRTAAITLGPVDG